VAGVEWYDSGIGFAVPLESILQRLEPLKQGKDQHAGILGIGLASRNPHSSAAELAAVRPDAPAGRAGLKRGDRIVEIDGRRINTQTDLRFALGTHYEGDSISVVAERGDERIERTIVLAGELPAFRHAFLGILPLRSANQRSENGGNGDEEEQEKANGDDEPSTKPAGDAQAKTDHGVAVRMIYPGSPAESAGIQAGDRIAKINGAEVTSIEAALSEMNNVAPEGEVTMQLARGSQTIDMSIKAAPLSANVPDELPPAIESAQPAEVEGDTDGPKAGETRELKLPEFSQQCKIYVPASHDAGHALGLLIWLHAPNDANNEAVIRDWQTICDRDGLLLVVPTAAEANRWERTELEYLARLTKQVLAEYRVDPRRVAVFGEGGGGAMAWLLGLSGRELFRGVATSNAPLPRQVRVPPNEPSQRLAILAATPISSEAAIQIAQGLQKCTDAGYPVTTITPANAEGTLSKTEREELARWIDTLDRF
jgi:serine protease Do